MMTPVYEVAIAQWKINKWSKHRHVARLDSSVFHTSYDTYKSHLFSAVNIVNFCCTKHLKKHFTQQFHTNDGETIDDFIPQKTHRAEQNPFLGQNKSSIRKIAHRKINNHFYSSRVHPLTYRTCIHSGKNILWQLTRFELMIAKVTIMSLTATPKSNRRLSPQPPLTRRSNAA